MTPEASDPALPRATLVIPTRDRPGFAAAAIEAVLAGMVVPDEIVVVDQSPAGASDDRLARVIARSPVPIRHLRDAGRGVSRARNVGGIGAAHDVLLFIDDDVLVQPEWCAAIRRALVTAGERAVVSGRLDATPPERPGGFAPSTTAGLVRRTTTTPGHEDVLYTGNAAMPRGALADVGWFDERLGPGTRFPAAEDNDLGHRLLLAGHAIVFEPEAAAWHRAWRGSAERLRHRWAYGRGQGAFLAKHAGNPGGSTAGRLRRTLRRHTGRAIRAWRTPSIALGEAAFVAGTASGAVEWLVRFGRRP